MNEPPTDYEHHPALQRMNAAENFPRNTCPASRMEQPLRPYIAFYQNRKIEVFAASSYAAQQEAAKLLKVSDKKRYLITVKLADISHPTSTL